MAEIAHLFLCKIHRMPMLELEKAETVANQGFRDCIHGRPGSRRQISLMDVETLEALGVRPGQVKENITTRGLDMRHLKPGVQLRIGEALLEVTLRCDPCSRMDEIRMGLQEKLNGRRGWLCRVVHAGIIGRGDTIQFVREED